MTTLAALLAASRVYAHREAIVASLKAALPFAQVQAHPGRLDVEDVTGETIEILPPAILVGVARIDPAEARASGYRDVPISVALYVVTKDMAVEGALRTRDELGFALCDWLLDQLADTGVSRWGLADIAPPEGATAMPLFTRLSREAMAFYAVTFRQVLYTEGQPLFPGGPDLDGQPWAASLPGDPGHDDGPPPPLPPDGLP